MQEFAEYKANRAETPPDLAEQIPYVRRVLEAMRIPILEYPGFEADDVIGTIARRAEAGGLRGGDRLERQGHAAARHRPRLHAQSGQGRRVVRPGEGQGVHGRARRSRWPTCWRSRATPSTTFRARPGIGDKGAQDLIERFGSVEAALERAAEVERKMYRESLQNNVERIRMSKRLATIATDVPIEFSLEAVKAQPSRSGRCSRPSTRSWSSTAC